MDVDNGAALPPLTLILGGARSGKSAHAEALIGARGGLYVATAEAGDAEMAERIARHRLRRGPAWQTLEEPLELAAALGRAAGAGRPILVDCLTLWLSNVMAAGRDVEAETARLGAALASSAAPIVVVANEVGLGIVPDTPLGRAFRDHAGRLNQAVARRADRVVMVVAGLAIPLKAAAGVPA